MDEKILEDMTSCTKIVEESSGAATENERTRPSREYHGVQKRER